MFTPLDNTPRVRVTQSEDDWSIFQSCSELVPDVVIHVSGPIQDRITVESSSPAVVEAVLPRATRE